MKPFIALLSLIPAAWLTPAWSAGTLDQAIHQLQQQWAIANYRTPEADQDKAFESLAAEAEAVARNYPDAAEPLVWQAIILSSHAGATGGLGALSKVKQARKLLESAEGRDPTVLNGSVYTSLGSLYYQVPGWPIGFGNDQKAEAYLKKALTVNADGIDPNYFYGDYLLQQKRYAEAVEYLSRALAAPPRPGRPVADEGRRTEVRKDLQVARARLGR